MVLALFLEVLLPSPMLAIVLLELILQVDVVLAVRIRLELVMDMLFTLLCPAS